jgi:branched-chain amino acid transport system permease protein
LLQRAREGLTPLLADLFAEPREPPSDTSESDALVAEPTPREFRYLKTRPRALAGPARPTLLRFSGVGRRFGGLVAVDNLSFEVARFEIVGLIGPNGAGKSTAFNLLTGALAPSAGRIFFNGKPIQGRSAHAIARRGIARTFQHVKLRPRMSVLDNVLIGAYGRLGAGCLRAALRLNQSEEAAARREALRWLARVGLAERAFDPAGQLSLGQQRLVEVARALLADPILLALDEPAAGLRRPEKQALAALLRRLRDEGLTILIVEHDMDFVMSLVDRLVVMDFGRKIAEGPPQEVRKACLGSVAGGAA